MPTACRAESEGTVPRAKGRSKGFDASPAAHFSAGFRAIQETRMKGLPILNPRLSVRADNFRRFGGDWLGTVVTPWSLAVLWVSGGHSAHPPVRVGEEVLLTLPGGDFPFLGCRDDILGEYRMMSLMSPVDRLEDQAAAEAVARIALDAMMTPQRVSQPEQAPERPCGRKSSRRAFLGLTDGGASK